jgi:hypothetical protein
MNFALINPRVWAELAVAALLAGLCWYGYNVIYDRGAASVQAKWDVEKADIQTKSAKVASDALATTKTLAATIDSQRSDFNAHITTLNATVASAIAGLRSRPARDSAGGVPRDPTTGAAIGATGANLLRQDSEFLIREAGRADKLRLQLTQCQAAYNTARDALK